MTLKLKNLAGYTNFTGPVITVIMDGMGIGKNRQHAVRKLLFFPEEDAGLCHLPNHSLPHRPPWREWFFLCSLPVCMHVSDPTCCR